MRRSWHQQNRALRHKDWNELSAVQVAMLELLNESKSAGPEPGIGLVNVQ